MTMRTSTKSRRNTTDMSKRYPASTAIQSSRSSLRITKKFTKTINYPETVIRFRRLKTASKDNKRHKRTERTSKPHGALLVSWIINRTPNNFFHLCKHYCAAERQPAKHQPETFDSLIKNWMKSMNWLKDVLKSAPVFTLPKTAGHMSLDAGARAVHTGCEPLQR